ncbi:hypothetical protein FBUS_09127, partial [Fasciolopsis buskii]
DPSCDISISLPTVAPVHCSLELLDSGLVKATSHSNSRFLLLIDGVELTGSRILPNGCLITVGDRHLKFFYPSVSLVVFQVKDSFLVAKVGSFQSGLGGLTVYFAFAFIFDLQTNVSTSGDCREESNTDKLQGTGSPKVILTPESLPKVHPSRKRTPKASNFTSYLTPRSRSATPKTPLGTRERYGPVPPRPIATPPTVQVLRHTPNTSSRSFSSHTSTAASKVPGSPLREARQVNLPAAQQPSVTQSPLSKASLRGVSPAITSPRQERSKSPGISLKRTILAVPTTGVGRSSLVSHALRNTPGRAQLSQGVKDILESPLSLQSATKLKKTGNGIQDQISVKVSSNSESATVRSTDMNIETPKVHPKQAVPNTESSQQYLKESVASTQTVYPQSAYVKRTGIKRRLDYRASMLTEDILRAASKRTKGVSFGPALSPEQFDKSMPPSTPVKKGAMPPSFSTPRGSVFETQHLTPASSSKSSPSLSRITSPSYFTMTPGRISGVISVPPTPDDNLLDSYDDRLEKLDKRKTFHSSKRHSAPIQKTNESGYKRPRNIRHSMGTKSTTDHETPRAPPSTPASITKGKQPSVPYRRSVNNSDEVKSKITPQTSLQSSQIAYSIDVTTTSLVENVPNKASVEVHHATPNAPQVTGVHQLIVTPGYAKISKLSTREELRSKDHVGTSERLSPTGLYSSSSGNGPVSLKSLHNRSNAIERSRSRNSIRPTANRRSRSTPSSTSRRSGVVGRSVVKTPGSVSRVVAKTPRMTGVRRLLKTPKSAISPRMSGVAGLFVGDEEGISTVGVSGDSSGLSRGSVSRRSSAVGRPRSTPSSTSLGRSVVKTPGSVSRVVAKTPRMTGVRRLLKTPKSARSPRMSGVAGLFVGDEEGISTVGVSGDSSGLSRGSVSRRSSAVGRPRSTPSSTSRRSGVIGRFDATSSVHVDAVADDRVPSSENPVKRGRRNFPSSNRQSLLVSGRVLRSRARGVRAVGMTAGVKDTEPPDVDTQLSLKSLKSESGADLRLRKGLRRTQVSVTKPAVVSEVGEKKPGRPRRHLVEIRKSKRSPVPVGDSVSVEVVSSILEQANHPLKGDALQSPCKSPKRLRQADIARSRELREVSAEPLALKVATRKIIPTKRSSPVERLTRSRGVSTRSTAKLNTAGSLVASSKAPAPGKGRSKVENGLNSVEPKVKTIPVTKTRSRKLRVVAPQTTPVSHKEILHESASISKRSTRPRGAFSKKVVATVRGVDLSKDESPPTISHQKSARKKSVEVGLKLQSRIPLRDRSSTPDKKPSPRRTRAARKRI